MCCGGVFACPPSVAAERRLCFCCGRRGRSRGRGGSRFCGSSFSFLAFEGFAGDFSRYDCLCFLVVLFFEPTREAVGQLPARVGAVDRITEGIRVGVRGPPGIGSGCIYDSLRLRHRRKKRESSDSFGRALWRGFANEYRSRRHALPKPMITSRYEPLVRAATPRATPIATPTKANMRYAERCFIIDDVLHSIWLSPLRCTLPPTMAWSPKSAAQNASAGSQGFDSISWQSLGCSCLYRLESVFPSHRAPGGTPGFSLFAKRPDPSLRRVHGTPYRVARRGRQTGIPRRSRWRGLRSPPRSPPAPRSWRCHIQRPRAGMRASRRDRRPGRPPRRAPATSRTPHTRARPTGISFFGMHELERPQSSDRAT